MSADFKKSSLRGKWVHSHEEDEGDRLVFRPSDFKFPPSRGRTAFTLKPDGIVEVGYPGPDDRPSTNPGRWTLEGSFLEIRAPGWSGTLEIVTADTSALVVRRIRKEE